MRVDDFDVELSPYTVFARDGQYVKMKGSRLINLLNTNKRVNPFLTKFKPALPNGDARSGRKSLKNMCFQRYHTKKAVSEALTTHLDLPPCMLNNLMLIKAAARGKRHSVRFVFNCYVRFVVGCAKCNKLCIKEALSALYDHDDKCVRELDWVFDAGSDYMPPNCTKMKDKYFMCKRAGQCKGANPIHNF